MKKFFFAVLATGLSMSTLNAQDMPPLNRDRASDSLDIQRALARQKYLGDEIEKEKERIQNQEKFKLKKALSAINDRLTANEISNKEATTLKEDAAKEAALNIDDKLAILEKQRQLLSRGNDYTFDYGGSRTLELGFGNVHDDRGSFLLGLQFSDETKKVQFDKRTYTDVVVATGLNNTLSRDRSMSNSPYKTGRSLFTEIGFTFRTRLLKDSNFYRLVYGTSLHVHTFELTGNRIFAVDGDKTTYTEFPTDLKFQKLRVTNLVFPAYLEFGNSKKTEYYDRFRYSTNDHFKFGLGGYAGLNIWSNQLLRYYENGRRINESQRRSFNNSNFVYGIGGYFGYGVTSFFVKYDLNPMFKDGPQKEQIITAGLRIDL